MTHDASERPHLPPQQKRKQEENMLTCSLFSRFPFYSFGTYLSLWGSATRVGAGVLFLVSLVWNCLPPSTPGVSSSSQADSQN